MNWTNNSLFNFVKKVLKELKIPFNDPCDATYTGECICSSGSVDIQAGTNVTITGSGTNANPYIINATGGGAGNPVVSGAVAGNTLTLTLADTSIVAIDVSTLISPTHRYTFLPTANIPLITAATPPNIPVNLKTGAIERVEYANGYAVWQYNGVSWDSFAVNSTLGPIINP